jgi:5-methylcytosine-specific restriction protein A
VLAASREWSNVANPVSSSFRRWCVSGKRIRPLESTCRFVVVLACPRGDFLCSHTRRGRESMTTALKPMRPCLDCGQVIQPPSDDVHWLCLCSECDGKRKANSPTKRGKRLSKKSGTALGYNQAWRRLSKEARRIYPYCMDCGTQDDLTADHLHWPARTLLDVEVVCRACNSKRGPLRKSGKAVSDRPGTA